MIGFYLNLCRCNASQFNTIQLISRSAKSIQNQINPIKFSCNVIQLIPSNSIKSIITQSSWIRFKSSQVNASQINEIAFKSARFHPCQSKLFPSRSIQFQFNSIQVKSAPIQVSAFEVNPIYSSWIKSKPLQLNDIPFNASQYKSSQYNSTQSSSIQFNSSQFRSKQIQFSVIQIQFNPNHVQFSSSNSIQCI